MEVTVEITPKRWYLYLKKFIVPIVFPIFFTVAALALPFLGQDISISWMNIWASIGGNTFSWALVTGYFIWAIAFLRLSKKSIYGPTTSFGQTPKYQANGVEYYLISLFAAAIIFIMSPKLTLQIYSNTPEIIATLNIVALLLCLLLTVKGTVAPAFKENTDAPSHKLFAFIYKFWCGAELHPSVLGIDIKQLTNCRVGLMAWQHLILAYFITYLSIQNFSLAAVVNFALQTVYLFKFFVWETGYFFTIDIIEDRASYYICWGCLVFVPTLYTWSTYYMVLHPPIISETTALALLLIGLASIYFNYKVDLERQEFRKGQNPSAEYIRAFYTDHLGQKKEAKLLTSGYWGKARHLNYTFEIILSFSWCFTGYGQGILPFLYPFFIVVLLLHRLYRDNIRCSKKYGTYWNEYCKQVPYLLIPGLV